MDALLKRIKELEAENEYLRTQVYIDPLTKLYNKRSFDIKLESMVDSCRRNEKNIAIIVFDIDDFKAYNDLYGHIAGDECLKKIADATKQVFERATDLIARWGGEEFIVAIEDCKNPTSMAEQLKGAIKLVNVKKNITVSQGIHVFKPDTKSIKEHIDIADRLMYLSKITGKNKFTSNI